jgi:hypothetical protein
MGWVNLMTGGGGTKNKFKVNKEEVLNNKQTRN